MDFARVIIATVLATGLVIIVIVQEITTQLLVALNPDHGEFENAVTLDLTFALLGVAIIILTVPDAIGYFKKRQNGWKKDKEDDE